MITVHLVLPKDSSGIAGYQFGKGIYTEQVEPKYLNKSEELTIVFPDFIERVASSFVQGFFSILIEEIGYEEVKKRVNVKMKNKQLVTLFWDRLY